MEEKRRLYRKIKQEIEIYVAVSVLGRGQIKKIVRRREEKSALECHAESKMSEEKRKDRNGMTEIVFESRKSTVRKM